MFQLLPSPISSHLSFICSPLIFTLNPHPVLSSPTSSSSCLIYLDLPFFSCPNFSHHLLILFLLSFLLSFTLVSLIIISDLKLLWSLCSTFFISCIITFNCRCHINTSQKKHYNSKYRNCDPENTFLIKNNGKYKRDHNSRWTVSWPAPLLPQSIIRTKNMKHKKGGKLRNHFYASSFHPYFLPFALLFFPITAAHFFPSSLPSSPSTPSPYTDLSNWEDGVFLSWTFRSSAGPFTLSCEAISCTRIGWDCHLTYDLLRGTIAAHFNSP